MDPQLQQTLPNFTELCSKDQRTRTHMHVLVHAHAHTHMHTQNSPCPILHAMSLFMVYKISDLVPTQITFKYSIHEPSLSTTEVETPLNSAKTQEARKNQAWTKMLTKLRQDRNL